MTVAKAKLLAAAFIAMNALVVALEQDGSAALRGTGIEVGAPAKSMISLTSDATIELLKTPFGMAFGVALGTAMVLFAGRSIKRTAEEKKRLQGLFDENMTSQQLQKMADSGAELPSLVIIRGVVSADGPNVQAVAPTIEGLKSQVGQIHQPANDYIKIAQMAKSNPNMKPITDKVAAQTGIKPEDIPDVKDDYSDAHRDFVGDAIILSEILVARLSVSVLKNETKDKDTGVVKITIKRTARKKSHACFYARKMSPGFHLLDMNGGRLELKLPSAAMLPQFSPIQHGEAPSLFLPVANVMEEFTAFMRKEGLTVQGQHLDLSNMPPSKVTNPDTLLSKFIFVDVQSSTEAGAFGGNPQVLQGISDAYNGAKFLWEPRGYYDFETNMPNYATDTESKMVSPSELSQKLQSAAKVNSAQTPFCEPTFSRASLPGRRDEENCFRVTELAIPRGSDVVVLAKPVKTPNGKVTLVPPNSAEDGADVDNPDAQRYRFRILKGHSIENLLKQRSVNIQAYYGFACTGVFLTMWAGAGYPGLG